MNKNLLLQLVDAAKSAGGTRQRKMQAVREQTFEIATSYRDEEEEHLDQIEILLEKIEKNEQREDQSAE